MAKRVAIVTGSNKGIGFAIVKALCSKFDGDVFLTARNEERGKSAVEKLKAEGLNPKFHLLDIEDIDSIKSLAAFIKSEYGGLDVLVNNAAIAYKMADTAPFAEQAENTTKINFLQHTIVVNMSSSAGQLSYIPDKNLQQKFLSESLTEEQLCDLMKQFILKMEQIVIHVGGCCTWGVQCNCSRQTELRTAVSWKVHPGYVDTDMTSHKGVLTPEQGAEAPVYLALLPPNVETPRGEFVWNDKTVKSWIGAA
ncbi:carbonyl reductase 1 [Caerostris extrusa]|uniref:Carbonyl reductase 1 n=1 Tax=Caerostris extrusa TaxID=172846 RepID=A0AAV4VVC3_CAEEX|nr:carbonyl reductase 1 [Caerostris extrusa]